jgi:hypothetical protein
MKYLLTFIVDERAIEKGSPEERQEALERWNACDHEAIEKAGMIACEPLEDSSTATTLRLRPDAEPIVTDGPFAESKEQLGGFCLLECEDQDEALEWARKAPMAAGSIEIRQVMDLSQFGYESKTLTRAKAAV